MPSGPPQAIAGRSILFSYIAPDGGSPHRSSLACSVARMTRRRLPPIKSAISSSDHPRATNSAIWAHEHWHNFQLTRKGHLETSSSPETDEFMPSKSEANPTFLRLVNRAMCST